MPGSGCFPLLLGTLILRIFAVALSMVRMVGGIILRRIGFDLFSPPSSDTSMIRGTGHSADVGDDVAFLPVAMPIMFGPGAIATVLGMTSLVKHAESEVVSFAALCATMLVTYLGLVYAKDGLGRIGPKGIDAATRLVGFFVSTIGMGLIFHGVIEPLHANGVMIGR